MDAITQRELRNDSGAVLRRVAAGESVVVTRNRTPVAVLSPAPTRRAVGIDALRRTFATAAPVDAGRFRADLDAVADQVVPDPYDR